MDPNVTRCEQWQPSSLGRSIFPQPPPTPSLYDGLNRSTLRESFKRQPEDLLIFVSVYRIVNKKKKNFSTFNAS